MPSVHAQITAEGRLFEVVLISTCIRIYMYVYIYMKYGSSTTSSSWTIIIGVWMDLLKVVQTSLW